MSKEEYSKGAWLSCEAAEPESSVDLERDISEAVQAGLSEY